MGTIKNEVSLSSTALMTGKQSEARVCPASEKGIRFHFANQTVEADIDNVVSTEHCVVIGNSEVKIMLIEHFMAACALCGIDALDIYLSHYELPILKGGGKEWIDAFNSAGILNPCKKRYSVKEAISCISGKTHIVILPSNCLNVTYSVNFNHKDLKNRWVSLDINNLNEIAQARTFGYLDELDSLQKAGYARGAGLENTLGLTHDGYTAELKSEFEPIKHKILDLIGDFYLAGCGILNFKGEIIVKEAGHKVHLEAAKMLKEKLIVTEE